MEERVILEKFGTTNNPTEFALQVFSTSSFPFLHLAFFLFMFLRFRILEGVTLRQIRSRHFGNSLVSYYSYSYWCWFSSSSFSFFSRILFVIVSFDAFPEQVQVRNTFRAVGISFPEKKGIFCFLFTASLFLFSTKLFLWSRVQCSPSPPTTSSSTRKRCWRAEYQTSIFHSIKLLPFLLRFFRIPLTDKPIPRTIHFDWRLFPVTPSHSLLYHSSFRNGFFFY